MLELTGRGEGKKDAGDRRLDIDIEDVSETIASVTVEDRDALWRPA